MTLTMLLIACGLIWLPLLFYQISHRGFLVLVIWLFIAPVASNVVNYPGTNPLFRPEIVETGVGERSTHIDWENTGKLGRLGEPTRNLLGAFLVVFLLQALLKKRKLGPLDRTETWMAIFSLILMSGLLLQPSVLVYNGLRVASDAFIIPFVGYYVVRRLVTNEDRFRQLNQAFICVACYLVVIGFIEFLMVPGHNRLGGPFFQNPFTLYINVTLAFFIVSADSFCRGTIPGEREAFPVGVRRFLLYMVPVIILLTWNRASWVGFLTGVWVFLFLGGRLISSSQKLRVIGLALLLGAGIGVSYQALVPEEMAESRVVRLGTVYGRIATWKSGLEEAVKHPILGIGLNNLKGVLARKVTQFKGHNSYVNVHNSYLSFFAEQGAVGLLAYLAIVASIFRMGLVLYRTGPHSRDRWRGVVVIAIMFAHLVPALFAGKLHIPTPMNSLYVYAFIGGIAGLYRGDRSVPTLHLLGLRRNIAPISAARRV